MKTCLPWLLLRKKTSGKDAHTIELNEPLLAPQLRGLEDEYEHLKKRLLSLPALSFTYQCFSLDNTRKKVEKSIAWVDNFDTVMQLESHIKRMLLIHQLCIIYANCYHLYYRNHLKLILSDCGFRFHFFKSPPILHSELFLMHYSRVAQPFKLIHKMLQENKELNLLQAFESQQIEQNQQCLYTFGCVVKHLKEQNKDAFSYLDSHGKNVFDVFLQRLSEMEKTGYFNDIKFSDETEQNRSQYFSCQKSF